jgi:C1A family cysteine protease
MPRKIARYGWVPDLPDHRDHVYSVPRHLATALPAKVDLRKSMPPVYDQGQIGSCTANAIAGAIEFAMKKQHEKAFVPSRLFVYWNERSMEHTVHQDAGAQIRDGIKVVNKLGAPPETVWPYDDTPADSNGTWPAGAKPAQKPSPAAFKAAKLHQSVAYQSVPQTLSQVKGVLASGFPVVFGFTVYDAFESAAVAKSGVLDLPGPKEASIGGHAVLCVGYDDAAQRFTIRNSWGPKWGLKGYFTMPYAYLLDPNLADDLWVITTME